MFLSCPPPPPEKPIIVWVHGTKASSVFPLLAINSQLKHRFNAFSRTPRGLKLAVELNKESRTYLFLKMLSQTDPEHFPWPTMYAFGWSGKLGIQERKTAALELYDALTALAEGYKRHYSMVPPIILISHSHGGNVILHMATMLNQNTQQFTIEKTILLACPVQQETAFLIDHPSLGTVYSLHSHVDVIQIMDPQRLQPYKHALEQWQETKSLTPLKEAYLLGLAQPLFSERHFPPCKQLIQANVCWKTALPWKDEQKLSNKLEVWMHKVISPFINQKRGVLHSEFIKTEFIKNLPSIITQLDIQMAMRSRYDQETNILI